MIVPCRASQPPPAPRILDYTASVFPGLQEPPPLSRAEPHIRDHAKSVPPRPVASAGYISFGQLSKHIGRKRHCAGRNMLALLVILLSVVSNVNGRVIAGVGNRRNTPWQMLIQLLAAPSKTSPAPHAPQLARYASQKHDYLLSSLPACRVAVAHALQTVPNTQAHANVRGASGWVLSPLFSSYQQKQQLFRQPLENTGRALNHTWSARY